MNKLTFLSWGVGTGKTKGALDIAMAQGASNIIVFAPPILKTMRHWELEAEKWGCDLPIEIHTYHRLQQYGRGDVNHKLPNGGEGVAIILDECLLGSTIIKTIDGDKRLKNIKLGDRVLSFNHHTNKTEYKKVTKFIKRIADDNLYCISWGCGSIISTYNHPFLTQDGYKMAKDIQEGDLLYETRSIAKQNNKIRRVPKMSLLRRTPSRKRLDRETSTAIVKTELPFLQRGMWVKESWGQNISSNEGKQSYVQKRYIAKNDKDKNGEWYFANPNMARPSRDERWKREYIKSSAPTLRTVRQSEQRLDYGVANQDRRTKNKRGLSYLLQSRYWKPILQNSYRMRRGIAQFIASTQQRQEEGQKIKPIRVGRVEIFKQSDNKRIRYCGKSDFVYCLEVEDNNNFFANGILTHNCHKIKNSQSLQGQGAFKLVRDNPKAVFYLLSGTPAPNGYLDFCNYAKMTGFVRNKTDFYNRYVIQQPSFKHKGMDIVGYRNTQELDNWWNSIADIKPPKVFTSEQDIWVEFPHVKNETYAKKTRVGLMRDGEKILLDNASKLTHYCRQVVCDVKTRQDWLENFLESTDDNVVVFAGYKQSMGDIVSIAKKLGKHVYRVDGAVKSLPDEATAKTLKNAVIAVNYQSGGAGLNLQYANVIVFYSPTYSYADYVQARGRISRRGQTKDCKFYHLRADKSIEHDIYECLKDKADFSIRMWNNQYAQDGEIDIDIL